MNGDGIPSIGEIRRRKGRYFVLWALPRGETVPYEVSREVPVIIEDRCPTSPYCPGERIPRIEGNRNGRGRGWGYVEDRTFAMDPETCPFGFRSKPECYRHINRIAFAKGSTPAESLAETARFLDSIGYDVYAESFGEDDLSGERILIAHGPLYNFHEFKVELGPRGRKLFLVRNPYENQMPPGAERCAL